MVLRPFTTWSLAHEGRINELIEQLDDAVKDWEGLNNEVNCLHDITFYTKKANLMHGLTGSQIERAEEPQVQSSR